MAKKRLALTPQGNAGGASKGKKRARPVELTREQTAIANTVGPIPELSDQVMRGSIVSQYRKDVNVDMTHMYRSTGDGAMVTTMDYIRAKGDHPGLRSKFTSRPTNFPLPARLGGLSQTHSVAFSGASFRHTMIDALADVEDPPRVLPNTYAPPISRSYPSDMTRVQLGDEKVVDHFIKPYYYSYLKLPEPEGYLKELYRRIHNTLDAEDVDLSSARDEKLEEGGYAFPCVPVPLLIDGKTIVRHIPLPGYLAPTYDQNPTTLKWHGADGVTWNALIEYREALLQQADTPSGRQERLRLEAVLKSMWHIANHYSFGVGNVEGTCGRIAAGAAHTRWAERMRAEAKANPNNIAHKFLSDPEYRMSVLRQVLPFTNFRFENPNPKYKERPIQWIYYEESTAQGSIPHGQIKLSVYPPGADKITYTVPTFKQNGSSDPGFPFDTKQGSHPDSDNLGVKKADVEFQALLMATVVLEYVDLANPSDLLEAVMGTFTPFDSVPAFVEYTVPDPTSWKLRIPPGALAFLRNVKLKEKKEVMTREKLTTKSRNIFVTNPVINVVASEFLRLPKLAQLSEPRGNNVGYAWTGFSPAHGGGALLFDMAARSLQNPDQPILRCRSDNAIIFEKGLSVSIDASQCEASHSYELMYAFMNYYAIDFWQCKIGKEGTVIDGGNFSRSGANFCLNVYPALITGGIGILHDVMVDIGGMLSGAPGTDEHNSLLVGSACLEIQRAQRALARNSPPGKALMIDEWGRVSPRVMEGFESFGIKMKVTAACVTHKTKQFPRTATFADAIADPYTLGHSGTLVPCGFLGFNAAMITLGAPGRRKTYPIMQLEEDRAMFALTFAKMQDDQRPQNSDALKSNTIALHRSLIRLMANNSVAGLVPLDIAIREAFRISNLRIIREIKELYAPGSEMDVDSSEKIARASKVMVSNMLGEFDTDLIGDPDITDYAQVIHTLHNYQLPFFTTVSTLLPLDRTSVPDPRTGKPFEYSEPCMLLIEEVLASPTLQSNITQYLPVNVINDIRDAYPDRLGGIDAAELARVEEMAQHLESVFTRSAHTGQLPDTEEPGPSRSDEVSGKSQPEFPDPPAPVWADAEQPEGSYRAS